MNILWQIMMVKQTKTNRFCYQCGLALFVKNLASSDRRQIVIIKFEKKKNSLDENTLAFYWRDRKCFKIYV